MRRVFRLTAVLIVGPLVAEAPACGAELTNVAPVMRAAVTEVAQLRSLVTRQWRVRCNLQLDGVVCAVSVPQQVMVFADASGAELFWLDLAGADVRVGQRVRLTGDECEVTRRREGLVLSRPPVVDNDGIHAARSATGGVELEAGWHPIRVEWFNVTGNALLEVAHADLGAALAPIPSSRLAQSVTNAQGQVDFTPGLALDYYEGGWAVLPDFDRCVVHRGGLATDFNLGVYAHTGNVGLVFSGWFQVSQSGLQTFGLTSDDGSRLLIGPTRPRLELFGSAPLPPLQEFYVNQPLTPTNIYTWAAGEGYVAMVEPRWGGWELLLRSPREGTLQVLVADGADLPPALLLKNKIQVRGVVRDVIVPGNQRLFGLLGTVSANEIVMLEAAPEIWTDHPVKPIAEVLSAADAGEGLVVRLSGRLETAGEGDALLLTDPTGSLLVHPRVASGSVADRDVQVLGFCRKTDEGWILASGFVRAQVPVQEPQLDPLALLTTAAAVVRLKPEEARLGYPVRLRGVITCLWPNDYSSAILQDSTRGVYVSLPPSAVAQGPEIGDFWEVRGVTAAGDFAPIVMTEKIARLSEGRLPTPVRPTSDQLFNGSLDSQYVEVEGIVTEVNGDVATLQMQWGKAQVTVTGRQPLSLRDYLNRLVSIRGCLLAAWDPATGQVRVGEFRLAGATIRTDVSLTADPFAAPEKTLADLFRFDVQAGPFQRVRVSGQVVARRGGEFFLMTAGGGLRFVSASGGTVRLGDMVEVAGFPQLGGPSPVLQEAVVRSQGAAELPQPRPLDPTNLLAVANDSTRVRVSALLVNVLAGTGRSTLLEMQLGRTPFLARAGFPADLLSKLRPGSQLELTGVYAGEGSGRRIDAFEILLDSPMSVRVLAQPPWLTLRRLLTALGLLLIGLAGTMLWVLLLRRRVEVQTRIIREKVEREATLEERTRIARELHDTLEQALAGLNFQLGALAGCLRGMSGEAQQTLERARSMARHGQEEARRTVRNLRMLELEQGNLPAALSQLAHDAANGVPIHIETVVHGTPQPLSAQVESHLLRIGQEALTNALKHAGAHSIRFELRYDPASVELRVTDDGCGFEVAGTAPTEAGHFGLLGMRERANKMGGVFSIHSQPGQGTTITVRVPRNKHAPPQTVSA